jgi:hypothetical protein
MEWHALKSLMAEENVDIDFDVPTDIELLDLLSKTKEFTDGEDDEDDEPLAI